MKVWTVILAGVILAAPLILGNSALEDAGVFVPTVYKGFEKRVLPANTALVCTSYDQQYEWFQINKFEPILLDFENGKNNMNATFRLGTPALLCAGIVNDQFFLGPYCKYLPKEFHGTAKLRSATAFKMTQISPLEYYAAKINDIEPATITMGFNKLRTLVENSLLNEAPKTYSTLIVEKTAAGVIYVGGVTNK